MAVYDIRIPDTSRLDQAGQFALDSRGPDGIAAELQDALRGTALFERWRQTQDEPDEVDPALGAVDAQTTVTGRQRNLGVDLVVTTTIPGDLLRHRLGLLAGKAWELRDVR
ncbi:hypothetical protein [Luteimonas qiangzhengi]|uniref:hypothetical protein n=1 Tax=Luteimonas sp. MJ146 TaxID=3129240 RepID=UPI0031BA2915